MGVNHIKVKRRVEQGEYRGGSRIDSFRGELLINILARPFLPQAFFCEDRQLCGRPTLAAHLR